MNGDWPAVTNTDTYSFLSPIIFFFPPTTFESGWAAHVDHLKVVQVKRWLTRGSAHRHTRPRERRHHHLFLAFFFSKYFIFLENICARKSVDRVADVNIYSLSLSSVFFWKKWFFDCSLSVVIRREGRGKIVGIGRHCDSREVTVETLKSEKEIVKESAVWWRLGRFRAACASTGKSVSDSAPSDGDGRRV